MTAPPQVQSPIYLPKGFMFSAVAAGIKASGRPDLALVEAHPQTTAAALFTRNRVVAAPLVWARSSLHKTRGRVRAAIVNSGNANCATGKNGLRACERICREISRLMSIPAEQVFPSSTGIIGVPLPVEKIMGKLPELTAAREASEGAIRRFAEAIMTTDTRLKLASTKVQVGSEEFALLGVAKGSGMIHPQLATMLVYLFTDVAASPAELKRLLQRACDETFNCISVDGDTSTNDTVLLLASGQSGVRLKSVRNQFEDELLSICQSLAEQIVSDGEGVQHVIHLHVEQARNREEALRVARAIAHSLLVKTAWAGADPNWGRILAAVGACGVPVRPEQIEIKIGSQIVFSVGAVRRFDKDKAHAELSQPSCEVRVRLRRGRSRVLFHTTDLSTEYVRINAEYST
ncbi:MAG TPA: bifunctional glutamate N-acetyltransferase/amino-acid acetyltransferase ArgJ [Terriglobales bacterium]|jgi:glutamate N-acetyltransferase/amino-acid N-acetyltransferase